MSIDRIPRPQARDLERHELEAFARALAARPELWSEHVRHDVEQRHYTELLADPNLTAWLICWMDDQDTGYHDHDVSAGAVAVIDGAVREERLRIDGPPRDAVYRSGGAFSFSAADIHRVRHAGSAPAVTLHVYSPPLLRMGAYEVDPGGVLVRHSVDSSEELRPPEDPGAKRHAEIASGAGRAGPRAAKRHTEIASGAGRAGPRAQVLAGSGARR